MSLNAELSYEEKIMNALSRVPRKRTDYVISRGKREFDAIRAVLAPLYAERDALDAELSELRSGVEQLTVRASFLAALSSNGARMLLADINRLASTTHDGVDCDHDPAKHTLCFKCGWKKEAQP